MRYPSDQIPECDRQLAPALALCVGAIVAVGLATSWLAYVWDGGTQFTREFSLRDPDGYWVTISELSSPESGGHEAP